MLSKLLLMLALLAPSVYANPVEDPNQAGYGMCKTYFFQQEYQKNTGILYWTALATELNLTVVELEVLCKMIIDKYEKQVASKAKTSI